MSRHIKTWDSYKAFIPAGLSRQIQGRVLEGELMIKYLKWQFSGFLEALIVWWVIVFSVFLFVPWLL